MFPVTEALVSDASLLAGYLREFGEDFSEGPAPGKCIATETVEAKQARVKTRERTHRRLIQVPSGEEAGRRYISAMLYSVFDEQNGSLVALGRFDERGLSNCELPVRRIAVSTGFGLARREASFATGEEILMLPALERGTLWIDPGRGVQRPPSGSAVGAEQSKPLKTTTTSGYDSRAGTDAKTGTDSKAGTDARLAPSLAGYVLRVGRETIAQRDQLSPEKMRLPFTLDGDLYRAVPNPSENFSATEILQTSFLVGSAPFRLLLEPGEYVVTLARPGKGLSCLARVSIRNGVDSPFDCRAVPGAQLSEVLEATLPAGGLGEARVDATFLPRALLTALPFREWLTAAGFTHVVLPDKSETVVRSLPVETSAPVDFSFAPLSESTFGPTLASGAPRATGPFAGLFSPIDANADLDRFQHVRVVTSFELLEAERHVERFIARSDSSLLPLAGTGEEGLASNSAPFLLTTRYRFPRDGGFSPDLSETLVSNGIDIEWLEPNPLEGTLPLRLPLQQRFRARVRVPAGYRPDYAELFVNQKLFRRWFVPRAEPGASSVFVVDERIDLAQDFTVALSVWGQAFLPELVYGSSTTPPIAFTRSYCIDANENGICEATR